MVLSVDFCRNSVAEKSPLVKGAGTCYHRPILGTERSGAPYGIRLFYHRGWPLLRPARRPRPGGRGDFDSLESERPNDPPTHTFPVEKDDTDTMLAIRYGLEQGYQTFHLYGGTGGRMDHTLANLQALGFLARHGARGYLYEEHMVFTALCNGSLTLPARAEGIFSLFCLGAEAKGVSIQGGQYPLDHGALSPFFPLGVSNHFQGRPVHIAAEDGCVLVGWEL